MYERPNTLRVRINDSALIHNFRTLKLVGTTLMPVLKADAYGHGLLEVGRLLEAEGATHMAVGVPREAYLLRQAGVQCRLYALLGLLSAEDAGLCRLESITPVVSSREHLDMLAQMGPEPMDIALKIDSGMSRLGFLPEEVPAVLERLIEKTPFLRPILAISHLATADTALLNPEHQLYMDNQKKRFDEALAALREKFPKIRASLANSAACIGFPDLHYDIQRPGIALYGVDPLKGTSRAVSSRFPDQALLPAMEVSAPILQIRKLKAGQSIGYGATFTADRPMLVGIIAAGYGENYSRSLTGRAFVTVAGQRAPLVGRVCMQMAVADLSYIQDFEPGLCAYLLGGPGHSILPEELASWWGSIPYEPMCVFGYSGKKEHY